MSDDVVKKRGLFDRAKKPKEPKTRPEIVLPPWNRWQGWVNVVLVFITLEVAVLSIDQAHWISPQPSLTLVLVLVVLLTSLAARLRIHGAFKPVIMVVIGLLVTLWQTISCLEPSEATSSFTRLIDIFQGYFQGSQSLLPGDNKIIYVVFITFVTWIIGYLSTWFILRKNNAWVTVVLGALVVLFNLNNLSDSYYLYFIFYFFAAALLIAVTRMSGQAFGLGQTSNYSIGSLFYLGISLLCITALAASISWITPQARATGLQDFIATSMPWQNDLVDSKANIFNVVPSKQSISTANNMKDINFGETWNQGDDIKYVVLSERPSYWRMNVYDTYSSGGWKSNVANKFLQNTDITWNSDEVLTKQTQMKYAVVNNILTDILFTNGGFISADIPVWLNVDAGREILSINAPRILNPGERYTVTTYVSTATEGDLAQTGNTYPDYIPATYLQLPDDLPEDIRLLSENVTANSTTPYAKVKAVVDYLAQFPYSLKVDPAPEGADNVEYFLFTRKTGFCLHYASAAVLMLRSVGVPARLAVGYLPGDPGTTVGQYIIRDKSYHAWPQVYFAGYGWVDIEATPGGAASGVTLNTPWISSPTLEESSQWNVWQGVIPPPVQSITNINVENIMKGGSSNSGSGLPSGVGYILLIVFGGILILALFIGVAVVMRSLSFRKIWQINRDTLAYDTYINMCRLAATVGIIPRPQQTPLEFTSELAAVLPQQSKEINFIARLYMDSRFGDKDAKPGTADEAEILKARHVVFHQLMQRLGKVKRLFVLGKR